MLTSRLGFGCEVTTLVLTAGWLVTTLVLTSVFTVGIPALCGQSMSVAMNVKPRLTSDDAARVGQGSVRSHRVAVHVGGRALGGDGASESESCDGLHCDGFVV